MFKANSKAPAGSFLKHLLKRREQNPSEAENFSLSSLTLRSRFSAKEDKIKGFSLIELLVVVAIISILATIGLTSYASVAKQSRDSKRKADLENFRSALEMFRSDNNYYPASLNSLTTGNYLQSVPADPQTTPYCYLPADAVAVGQYNNYSLYTNLETLGAGSYSCSTNSYNYKLTPLGAE